MRLWALGAGLLAWGMGSVAYGQTSIVGKWCDNTHQNGTRTLVVEKIEGDKVSGRYKWSGPGPLDEAITGTYRDGQFKGAGTVGLNIKLDPNGNLVGGATRSETLPVTFKRCK